ncbi:MAG TPA: hypothetical protein VEB22_15555 [Phycisphaerales bacterium]|nr:hypothetical protein [Phycisphaerales bacterium]
MPRRPTKPSVPRGPGSPRAPVPVEQLPAEYRRQLVEIVRDLTRTLEICARKLRERSEEALARGVVPGLDPDMTRAMLDLTKTSEQLIASYPGLVELVHARDVERPGEEGGDAAAERLRRALGVPGRRGDSP